MKALLLFLFALFLTATGGRPAAAEVNYPWCIITGGTSEGVYSCGYVSFAQCQQTRIGSDMCVPNPRYQSAPAGPRERGRRPQR